MADVDFLDQSEEENDLSSDYFNGGEDEYPFEMQETQLPIDKLDQYIQSESSYTRHLVAEGLLDVLKSATNKEERMVVLDALNKLAHDEEPNVRAEIMDQVPNFTEYCFVYRGEQEGLVDAVSTAILPAVVRCLHDSDNQVRKTSQAALLVLLENHMVDNVDVEELICPVIMDLLVPDALAEEYRTEAVVLMTRISSLVPRHIVEKFFLPKFCELCVEHLFHIRKVCASNFGEMCRVVGPQLAEDMLLPKFFSLCEDGIWGVRKACTECFMDVSNSLSPNARRNDLAQLFIGLLCDQSRWVRMSAFQTLGPFISTFADPETTGLYFDKDGILCVQPVEKKDQSSGAVETPEGDAAKQGEESGVMEEAAGVERESIPEVNEIIPTTVVDSPIGSKSNSSVDMDISESEATCESELVVSNQSTSPEEIRWKLYGEHSALVVQEGEEVKSKIAKENMDFDSFNYWRDPVPTLDLQSILTEVTQGDTPTTSTGAQQSSQQQYTALQHASGLDTPTAAATSEEETPKSVDQALEALANKLEGGLNINSLHDDLSGQGQRMFMFGPNSIPAGSSNLLSGGLSYASALVNSKPPHHARNFSFGSSGGESNISISELMAKEQDVIPHLLLENYLSMTDPSRAQTVDTDIAQHCAYSLPAVAFTLGKDNWKCLRTLYETLVSDMQWKVRRTLAFSIHELAVILGPEATHEDLVPIFNGFLKDLDEVRIGVLKHLANFLRLLNQDTRRSYLPKLVEFLESDNLRVWRSRLDLAEQLTQLCDLYSPTDVMEHIVPLALCLLGDRVADVRMATYPLLSRILYLLQDDSQRVMLINDVIDKFAQSDKWHCRQTFVQACHRVLVDNSLDLEQFAIELLPSIIALSVDKIPNVRLAVAKVMSQCLLPLDYFTSSKNPHHDELVKVEATLKSDSDKDVKYFAGLAPQTVIEHHNTVEV